MAFPTTPVNGQQVVINNITYQWSSSYNAWVRLVTTANIITANSVTVISNVTAGSFLYTNGVSVTSNIQSTVNNLIHPFLLAGM